MIRSLKKKKTAVSEENMGKSVFIAEKPSVAKEFAKVLKENGQAKDGYIESGLYIVTWCVGHLVTMSYPEVYDENLKKWKIDTLPFIPDTYKYQVIDAVKKQYEIVKKLLLRDDVDTIYVCTDSGREGEYIYRLVENQIISEGGDFSKKNRRRVWIDSQTEEEILRGIKEAKDLSEYDNLCAAAYLRAKEDYLMGINFSRVLTLTYGNGIKNYLKSDQNPVIAVGRVMSCVLGMIVRREREIREFVKTPFYRVIASVKDENSDNATELEWRATDKSKYFESPLLYKENGFKERKNAEELIGEVKANSSNELIVTKVENKKETNNPPLLFNLAEAQNQCSKLFKISPEQTLNVIQELYEKKLVTYPRTDARVLSSAIAKEIEKNIKGLKSLEKFAPFADDVLALGRYKTIAKTKYVDDKQITDHYAIIPTGQGFSNLKGINPLCLKVYELIVRRFLSIFYPPAIYNKVSLTASSEFSEDRCENFFVSYKELKDEGYLKVAKVKKNETDAKDDDSSNDESEGNGPVLKNIKKHDKLCVDEFMVKEGETSPPKPYNSGSLILAMENAGKLIEDEDLRALIKSAGIGTSATRAEIISKLVQKQYIRLNQKTQVISPTQLGEMIVRVVEQSIPPLLNPELTASWEKGLKMVAEGEITEAEYLVKLDDFVSRRVNKVKTVNNVYNMRSLYDMDAKFYK